MKPADLLAVVADTRLTPDAVRVVLHYALAGDGPRAYDADELRELLEEGGPKRIAAALRRAERHGYLVRKPGGRGRTDSFTVCLRPAAADDVSDTPARTDGLSALRPAAADDLSAVVVGEGEVTTTPPVVPHGSTEDGDDALPSVDESPPLAPPAPPPAPPAAPLVVEASARAVVEAKAALLNGTALRLLIYLANRVPPDRQRAYAENAIALLEGDGTFQWRNVNGFPIPPPLHTRLLADALNELGAADEAAEFKSKTTGSPRNLRSKLEALARAWRPDGSSSDGGGADGGAPGGTDDGGGSPDPSRRPPQGPGGGKGRRQNFQYLGRNRPAGE